MRGWPAGMCSRTWEARICLDAGVGRRPGGVLRRPAPPALAVDGVEVDVAPGPGRCRPPRSIRIVAPEFGAFGLPSWPPGPSISALTIARSTMRRGRLGLRSQLRRP